MYSKALVTGGAGFIGSHLTRALLDRGMEVRVLDDLSMGKRENVPAGADFHEGNVCRRGDVQRVLADVEIVFHEAARVSIRGSVEQFYEDAETNLMGTLNLLRCLAGSSVRKLIVASSMAVYADCETARPIGEDDLARPISPYGVSKLAAEQYCLQCAETMNFDCIVLRYFNTFGPGQTFTPYVGVMTIFTHRLLNGEPPVVYGDGEQRRDFVHVGDIIAANLLAMDSQVPRGVFNVGTSQATSVNEIAQLLCDRIRPDLRPQHVEKHPGELRNSIADIRRAREVLGFSPRATIADRIDDVIESCRRAAGSR